MFSFFFSYLELRNGGHRVYRVHCARGSQRNRFGKTGKKNKRNNKETTFLSLSLSLTPTFALYNTISTFLHRHFWRFPVHILTPLVLSSCSAPRFPRTQADPQRIMRRLLNSHFLPSGDGSAMDRNEKRNPFRSGSL